MVVRKAPHQQFQEADKADWQKELVVKSVVPWNHRELREFLKRANHFHCFVKDYSLDWVKIGDVPTFCLMSLNSCC